MSHMSLILNESNIQQNLEINEDSFGGRGIDHSTL
jgi:hypothetical protein